MRPAAIHVVGIAALLLVCGPWTAVAQEEEGGGRGLEDILKDVVRDVVEEQGSSELGRIAKVSVTHRAPSLVELNVDLEGISEPDQVALTAEVFDQEYRAIAGFDSGHGLLPDGDGTVLLTVSYSGTEAARSVGVKVALVAAGTDRVVSRRKVPLPWEWTGGEAGSGTAGGATALAARGSGEPAREPAVVSIEPSRVADTPAMESLTIAGARVAQRPAPVEKPPAGGGTTTGPAVLGTAVRFQAPTVDLYGAAAKAAWTSDKGRLPFNGETGDSRGYVRALGEAKLNDGQVHQRVLQTHPAFQDNGHVVGAFSLGLPKGATVFEAGAGFLPNVSKSDGVKATVRIGTSAATSVTVVSRTVRPSDGVVKIRGNLPTELQGKDVILTLHVQAGPTSTQDWFAWSEPTIR
ncbi:MAG TPA: hypothetical protein PLS95_13425 [Thermoanaerobaculales bacterium]|nr:hypothetical protein [Thermoanaerobaculales bacterium]